MNELWYASDLAQSSRLVGMNSCCDIEVRVRGGNMPPFGYLEESGIVRVEVRPAGIGESASNFKTFIRKLLSRLKEKTEHHMSEGLSWG
jgi:hypothetical protein